jgi:hypothetical protein
MEKNQTLVFLAELRALCDARQTGTLLIATDDNSLAQFALQEGNIVGVAFKGRRGRDALPLITALTSGRVRFHQRALLAPTPPLPSTTEILTLFGAEQVESGLGAASGRPVPPSPRQTPSSVVPPSPEPAPVASPPQPALSPEVCAVLQSSLASFIGPIAAFVCAERLPQAKSLDEALQTLSQEIPDPTAARRFRDMVRRAL